MGTKTFAQETRLKTWSYFVFCSVNLVLICSKSYSVEILGKFKTRMSTIKINTIFIVEIS